MLTECKETAAKRNSKRKQFTNPGIPEEELIRIQEELFAKARETAALQEMQKTETNSLYSKDGSVQNERGHDREDGSDEESEY